MPTHSNQLATSRDVNFTRWLFRAYLLLLFLMPLPLGSNRPIFWSLMVAGIALIMLAWVSGLAAGVARWPGAVKRAQWVLIALALFVLWGGVQTTGLLPAMTDGSASADAVLLSLGLFMLGLLTVVLVRSRRRALLVLYTLVLAGLLQAIYGSLMTLSGVEFGFFEAKQFGRGVSTGTFINRNHYANLLVLALSAGVGLLLAQMDLKGAPNMRQRLRSLLLHSAGIVLHGKAWLFIGRSGALRGRAGADPLPGFVSAPGGGDCSAPSGETVPG